MLSTKRREREKLTEMMDTSKAKGNLSSERSKLFELLLKKIRIILPSAQTIPKREVSTPCQLSMEQEAIWSSEQAAPGSPRLILSTALRMKGKLNEEALRNSLQSIIDRHEILRTSFPVIDSNPVQSISSDSALDFQLEDLTEVAAERRLELARQIANQEARRGFDLATGPVIRTRLLRLSQEERVLIVSLHHIVADGWSMRILMREMREFYEGEVEGREAKLEELAVQYADYAVWQRERMKGEWYEQEKKYWREKLTGVTVTEVETDQARPVVSKHRGRKVSLEISKELREEMKEMRRREGVTEYVVMLAGLKGLLSRKSGEEGVVIGTAVANRNQWEVEASIGMYANVVVVRSDLGGNPRMREVIERVRGEVIEVMGHQELAYEKVVEEVRGEREASREGMIGVMFVMGGEEEDKGGMEGIEIEEMEVEEGVSKYDVKVEVEERGGGMRVKVEYDEELYEREGMERLIREYERVIEVMVREPDRRLWDLPELVSHRASREE